MSFQRKISIFKSKNREVWRKWKGINDFWSTQSNYAAKIQAFSAKNIILSKKYFPKDLFGGNVAHLRPFFRFFDRHLLLFQRKSFGTILFLGGESAF